MTSTTLARNAAGPLIADDEPSAVMLAGMPVGAADGMLGEPGRHGGEPGVLRLRDLPSSAAGRLS